MKRTPSKPTNPQRSAARTGLAGAALIAAVLFGIPSGTGPALRAAAGLLSGGAVDLVERALSCLDFALYDEAVSLFEKTLDQDPDRPGIRRHLGYALYRVGRMARAREILDLELERYPEDLNAVVFAGFLARRAGRSEEAERFARMFDAAFGKLKKADQDKALRKGLSPNAGIPAFILGLTASERGDADSAVGWFVKARDFGYDPQECWAKAIDAFLRSEEWSGALRLCPPEGSLGSPKKDGKASLAAVAAVPSAEIYARLGYVCDKLGRSEDSLNALKTAAAMKPFDAGILKSLAIAHLNRGEAAAESFFSRVVKLDPLDFESRGLLERARILCERAERDIGLPRVPLPADFPKSDGLRFRYVFSGDARDIAEKTNSYALRMIRDGLVDDAYRYLRSFSEIYENSPTVFFNLGLLANSLDKPAEALENAMRALALDPDDRDAFDLAANACFNIGDFATSAAFYERAVEIEPDDPISHYNLGLADLELGDAVRAESQLQEAVRLEKAPAGRREAAETETDVLKRAVHVKVEPISGPACVSLGFLFLKQGKLDEALASFERAVDFTPRHPAPYFEIGKILYERNERAKAEDYFKIYLSLGGDEAKVREIRK
jgi:tetratricopeptide (TPR) repeat protein